jgi:hypothetical protein
MQELIRYETARRALAEAHTVDEVKVIRDKAVALEAYARQAKDPEMEVMAFEIRIVAERRAGELLLEMKERGERAEVGRPQKTSNTTTISALGISKDQSSRWQQLALVPSEHGYL